jgi:hypothetical protein
VRPRFVAVTLAATTTFSIAALAPDALASPTTAYRPASGAHASFTNLGDTSPSVALSVSPAGQPEAAAVGKGGSLKFYYEQGTKWHGVTVGKAGSAFSGPALAAGPHGTADIAVEGARHTLQYYALSHGHWRHVTIAGNNSTYSVPSIAIGPQGPAIAVRGAQNRLWYYSLSKGHWHASKVFGVNAAFSAPSLVIRAANQVGFGPAGQADIAVENANNSLGYYFSMKHGGWGSGLILGSVHKVYSAPSLMVIRGSMSFRDTGSMVIAFEGPHHSLMDAVDFTNKWSLNPLLPSGLASAPSVAQGDDANLEVEIAYRAGDRTLQLYFPYLSTIESIAQANFMVSSAPVLVVRGSHPSGENDLLLQGTNNTLWYYGAPYTPTGPMTVISSRIAGPGTTFGG